MWKNVLIVLLILAVVVLGGFLYQKNSVLDNIQKRAADCAKLGDDWASYFSDDFGFSFCYKKEWGEPHIGMTAISPQCKNGNAWEVGFKKSNPLTLMGIYTSDFSLKCNSDSPGFDWSQLDLTLPDSELAKIYTNQFSGDNDKLERFYVSDKEGVHIYGSVMGLDFESSWAIPSFHTGYNMMITLYNKTEDSDVSKMINSMVFSE